MLEFKTILFLGIKSRSPFWMLQKMHKQDVISFLNKKVRDTPNSGKVFLKWNKNAKFFIWFGHPSSLKLKCFVGRRPNGHYSTQVYLTTDQQFKFWLLFLVKTKRDNDGYANKWDKVKKSDILACFLGKTLDKNST